MTEMRAPAGWDIHKLPPGMSRRYEFDSYAETRQFLDDLAQLSERMDYYPSLNFKRTQVIVRIQPETAVLGETEYRFAAETDALLAHKATI